MILAETHLHTKEASACAAVPAAEIPMLYKNSGYDLIVVTDHFNKWYLEGLSDNPAEQIEKWLSGYRGVKKEGDDIGIKTLLGMELALTEDPKDILVYGFDESFIYKYPELYNMDIEKVRDIARKEGLLIYQAHPFREYISSRVDPEYLDGVEVYNGNPRHASHNEKAEEFAQTNSLMMMSGSDFHQYEDLARGGIYLPEDIGDSKQLVAYLKNNEVKLIRN